jgi:hypothetical protein
VRVRVGKERQGSGYVGVCVDERMKGCEYREMHRPEAEWIREWIRGGSG